MGYQKLTLGSGFNWVAPQFITINANGVNIQDIRLAVNEETAQGAENIQILDETGYTTATYYWLPAAWMGTAGWYDENVQLANLTLNKGQSILVDCADDQEMVATVFGEVADTDYQTTSVNGFNWVGNTTPVPINIQDVTVNVAEETAEGAENIQILDETGYTISTYYWLPAAWMGTAGWYDENVQLADVTLDAGDGFLVDTPNGGLTITVPSAL